MRRLNSVNRSTTKQAVVLEDVEQVFYSRNSVQRFSISRTHDMEWFDKKKQITRKGHLPWAEQHTLRQVYFSPQGKHLLFQDEQGEFLLWQTEQWQAHPFQPTFDQQTKRVIFDQEGKYLFSQNKNKQILQYKISTGQWQENTFEYTANDAIKDIVISRDDRYSVMLSEKHQLLWYQRENGDLVNLEPAFVADHEIKHLQFSPDSQTTVSVGKKGDLVWWNTQKGTLLFPLPPKKMAKHLIKRIIFSPNGRQLVSLGNDNSLVWWDSEKGEALSEPIQVHEELRDVVFHPEGALMLSIGKDHIALWDSTTQKLIARQLRLNPFYEKYLTHAPDGSELAFRSSSGHLVFMPFPDNLLDELKQQACKIAGRNLSQAEWKVFIGQSQVSAANTTQMTQSAASQQYSKTCKQYPKGVERLENVVVDIEKGEF